MATDNSADDGLRKIVGIVPSLASNRGVTVTERERYVEIDWHGPLKLTPYQAQPPDRPDADVLARLRKAGEDIELRRGFIARLTWEAVQVGACGMRWQGFRFPIENGTVRSVIAVKEKQREAA